MQSNQFTVLTLGDVVGSAGVSAVCGSLRKLKNEYGAELVLVNAENCSDSNGLDVRGAEALLDAGADVLTGGNHTLRLRDVFDMLDENERLLRPINLPPLCPGHGYCIVPVGTGLNVLVINAIGQTFMSPADNPFVACDRLLKDLAGKYDLAVCDLHAEATSEKAAFAEYFDGRINIVYGTHTHVQTADRRVLPNGTGFITDLGMCGVTASILGVRSDTVINRFLTSVGGRFERAEGAAAIHGAAFTIDPDSKRVTAIERIELDPTMKGNQT